MFGRFICLDIRSLAGGSIQTRCVMKALKEGWNMVAYSISENYISLWPNMEGPPFTSPLNINSIISPNEVLFAGAFD